MYAFGVVRRLTPNPLGTKKQTPEAHEVSISSFFKLKKQCRRSLPLPRNKSCCFLTLSPSTPHLPLPQYSQVIHEVEYDFITKKSHKMRLLFRQKRVLFVCLTLVVGTYVYMCILYLHYRTSWFHGREEPFRILHRSTGNPHIRLKYE